MSHSSHAQAVEDLTSEFEPGVVGAVVSPECNADAGDQHSDDEASIVSPPEVPQVTPYALADLVPERNRVEKSPIDLLRDVELDLNIELGRTELELEEIRRIRSGTVVALDRRAGEPVDVVVNGQLIARGEVIVMDGKLCVRVSEVLSGEAA